MSRSIDRQMMDSSGESGLFLGSTIHRSSSSPVPASTAAGPTTFVPTSQMYQQQQNLPPVHSSSATPSSYPASTLFSVSALEHQNALRAAALSALRQTTTHHPAMIHHHSTQRFFTSVNPSTILNLDHHPHHRPPLPHLHHQYPFHVVQSPLRVPSDIGSPSPSTDGDSVIDLQSNEDVSLSDDRKIMKGLHQSRIYPGQFPGHHTKELNEFNCKEVENNEVMNTNDNLPIGTGGKKVRSGGKTVSHFSTTPK